FFSFEQMSDSFLQCLFRLILNNTKVRDLNGMKKEF
ncbi:MAG: hypothetical protein ACI81G_001464, partial [Gammaproteobacteria bacterium]